MKLKIRPIKMSCRQFVQICLVLKAQNPLLEYDDIVARAVDWEIQARQVIRRYANVVGIAEYCDSVYSNTVTQMSRIEMLYFVAFVTDLYHTTVKKSVLYKDSVLIDGN